MFVDIRNDHDNLSTSGLKGSDNFCISTGDEKMKKSVLLFTLLLLIFPIATIFASDHIIVDHRCADLTQVPSTWIDAAKTNLHIAYGHTSHGSQVTSGMSGLVTFTGGVGGPKFAWNNGGSGGALDFHDYAMGGDCGYYPQWVNNTKTYLNNPNNADVNVIIWSWCGQHAGYSQQDMITKYLAPMTQLEIDYPKVKFVYMTGHLTYSNWTNCNARNEQIRKYCIKNDKILYDFAHIESFDPDKIFYSFASDTCDYWDLGGKKVSNWAIDWQNSHVLGTDWYSCGAAHSQPLNSNQKAYAAWWLWARLAGWEGPTQSMKADTDMISATRTGEVNFNIDAGAGNSGRYYLIFGTMSGAFPGIQLPGGKAILPINWDIFTTTVYLNINKPVFQGFVGNLDTLGQAIAKLKSPVLAKYITGESMHFAYMLDKPFDFASNSVRIVIEP